MRTLEADPTAGEEHVLAPQFQIEEFSRHPSSPELAGDEHNFETGRRDVETLQILSGLVDICEVRNEDQLDDLVDMVVNGVINHFSPDYRLNETIVSILREKVESQKAERSAYASGEAVPPSLQQDEAWQKPTESQWLKPGRVPL